MLQSTTLETERLIIRPFDLQDTESLYEILKQEEVVRYLPKEVMSLEEVKRTIAWLTECYQKNTPDQIVKLSLAVVWKKDQKLLGWCGLGPLDFSPQEIEIYYGFSQDHWGRGIATEAAKAVLNFGFAAIKLNKIVAITRPENIASIRVIKKIGLIYEKTVENLPHKYRWFDGCLYYSLSRNEYLGMIKG